MQLSLTIRLSEDNAVKKHIVIGWKGLNLVEKSNHTVNR